MKPKLCILTFLALAAFVFTGWAQTTPAADTPTNTPAAMSAGDTATPAPAAQPAPAEPAAAEQPAPATQPVQVAQATPAAAEAATPAAQPATEPAAAAPATTPAPDADAAGAQPGAIIPLIVMDDVPLTDAIRNLARQAGLNYMLDPRIGFGQLGPDGKPAPQPSVSIRWENVSAEQALMALLQNYNLQLVQDVKTKIARVTIKDPAAPDPLVTKIIQLKYASPSNILASVQSTMTDKRSRVVADVRTSQLVILATEKELADMDSLIARLDTQTRQVLIEARLMETLFEPSTTKGIDWSGTLKGQNVTFGNGLNNPAVSQSTTTLPGASSSTTLPSGRPIVSTPSSSVSTVLSSIIGGGGLGWNTASGFTPGIGFLNADGVRAVLSFLNTYAETKIISSPRTVTLDNEPSSIEVGTMFPIVNVQAGTVQTAGGSSVTYSNLTVRLDVTPRISANNYVYLKVSPKVLRLGDAVTTVVGSQNNTVFSFSKRELDTTVMIPSGNTLVMGGLMEDNVHNQNTKVPILGDIPVLGLLFRSDSKSRAKSNLLVFLTPTIVNDNDFQPTTSEFLKTPVPTKDTVEGDWSAWDSGKPKDWSKSSSSSSTP